MSLANRQQISNATQYDRYPRHYKLMADIHGALFHCAEKSTANVLVFGCSTGEEPFSLAQNYFNRPNQLVDAVDVCEETLRTAKASFSSPRINYFHSRELEKVGPKYDIIFANSVFCVHPPRELL